MLILGICIIFNISLYYSIYFGLNDEKTLCSICIWGCGISGIIIVLGSLYSTTVYGWRGLWTPLVYFAGIFLIHYLGARH